MLDSKPMEFTEHYGKLGEPDDFDQRYWQAQGPEAIFDAAWAMIRDYLLLKDGHADEPRLQRTVEAFRRG